MLNYPGGIGVFGSKITISKEDDQADQDHDYQATYNLKIDYINATQTDLTWELYMIENDIDALKAQETTICKLQEIKDNATGQTKFWYADEGDNGQTDNTSCTASAIISKLTSPEAGLNAKKIANGTLKANQTDNKTINKDSASNNGNDELSSVGYEGDLTQRTINTKTTPTKFYYLVVKYPNKGESQNSDFGKQIKVSLNLDGKPASTLYTAAE